MGRIRKLDVHGFSFEDMLYQRGHVLAGNPGHWAEKDTVVGMLCLNKENNPHFNVDKFYDWFSAKTNRVSLRTKVLQGESQNLFLFDGLFLDTAKVTPEMYSKTFEWYVSELLVREFKFIAAGFRVLLQDGPDGGDYDVLGFSANDLVYIEAKSGRPNNISLSDLQAFVKRAAFLTSTISILYVDFEGITDYFNFRDLARATDAWSICQITNRQSGAKLYRAASSNIYVLENQAKGNVLKNLRYLFLTHYAFEASLRNTHQIHSQLLNPDQFEVAWFTC